MVRGPQRSAKTYKVGSANRARVTGWGAGLGDQGLQRETYSFSVLRAVSGGHGLDSQTCPSLAPNRQAPLGLASWLELILCM